VIILDWVLLAIVGYFIIRGLFRGFVLELFDLLALLAGYFAARLLSPVLGQVLANNTPINRWFSGVLAAIVLFIVAAALVRLAASMLRNAMHAINLAGFDRLLGAVFGFLKAFLIILVLFLLLSLTPWAMSIGDYATEGEFSSWFWLTSQLVREAADFEPITGTQAMARWLRAAGVNEEAVHIIADRPDLMPALLDQARLDQIDIPIDQILSGEPNLSTPKSFDLDEETQEILVSILEDSNTDAREKAILFWRELEVDVPQLSE